MHWTKNGFSLMAEITRCHTFIKEINPVSVHSQYCDENFCCKNSENFPASVFYHDRKAGLTLNSNRQNLNSNEQI